jgi:hypothetical protein
VDTHEDWTMVENALNGDLLETTRCFTLNALPHSE